MVKATYSANISATKKLETVTYNCKLEGKFLYSIIILSKNQSNKSKRTRAEIINQSVWCLENQLKGVRDFLIKRQPILRHKINRLEGIIQKLNNGKKSGNKIFLV